MPGLPATTVQLPTFGISIDAEGTLDARTFRDFDGKLLAARLAAAKAAKPGDLWAPAKLRKLSLVRLEAVVAAEIAAGRGPDDAMRSLAGLTKLQYVFCYPPKDGKPGDIIIAGPAEPWGSMPPDGQWASSAGGQRCNWATWPSPCGLIRRGGASDRFSAARSIHPPLAWRS